MNRTRYSIINSMVATGSQSVNIIIKFIVQTIFIHTLGVNYLGINGLFTNILSILAFAELGIGNAIIFSLYKPLANNDYKVTSSIMHFYKVAYTTIGCVIALAGIIITPFITLFIKGNQNVSNIHLIFILFLTNTVVSYFFTYKRSLLIADQKGYLSVLNQTLFTLLQAAGQIIILFALKSFILFLSIQILCTILSNILISLKVDNMYPYIRKTTTDKIPQEILDRIKSNTIGMMGSRVGSIAINSTDSLLISSFLGLKLVGIYSNYFLIVNSVTGILTQLVNSVSSSIGNLIVSNQSEKITDIYNKHDFINFVFTSYATLLIFSLINPFIHIWIGYKYQFNLSIVFLFSVNFMFNQLRQTNLTFISSFGLFSKIGTKSIIEAFVNVCFGLVFILIMHLGIEGVILANILSNFTINLWYEPYVIFSYGLKQSDLTPYALHYVKNVIFILLCMIPLFFGQKLFYRWSILTFLIWTFISLLLISLLLFLYVRKNKYFKYMYTLFMKLLKRK